ncbi:MAG: hypothetical protein ACXWQO_02815 [Bdellovibrionota bacterium]
MSRILLTCLALILANNVIAQADFLDNGGLSPRIQTGTWTPLYAGTTELDGIKVLAVLEKSEREITIPNFMASSLQTLVPLSPTQQKTFRLSLVAIEQSTLKVSFPLQTRTGTVEGRPAVSYFSQSRPGDQFEFSLVPRTDGTLNVQYHRTAEQAAEATGEFGLEPLPQLF